jgi:tetratricopeptide (TPR) repeat protein
MYGLADSYDAAGRRDEALKLREQLLSLSRKVLGPEHPDTLNAIPPLADSYDKAGRLDKALKLREQELALYRKVLGPEHPDTLSLMGDLAKSYCVVGRDKEAIAILEQACELNPKDTDASLTLATWQAWFGQDADYEATRHRLVQQAEGTDQAGTAERAAKVFCLRPSTDAAMLAKALNLARQGVELGKSSSLLPWYHLALGLAAYRNSQYTAADEALTVAEQTAAGDGKHDIQGAARLFRAMSLFRQGKPEAARKVFSQAEAQMPPLPKDESKPLVDGKPVSHDVLICWLAYKEAKALLEGAAAPVAEPSVPK